MKKAYQFGMVVLPKNLEKVKKIIEENKELFVRTHWGKTEVQLV